MTPSQKALTAAGVAAAILYAVTRTQKGQAVTSDALEEIIVTGRHIAAAVLPRGIRNNNPGNIRYIANPSLAWRGQMGTDGSFGIYDTAANGVRAIGKQLLRYEERGLTTVRKLISTWAPSNENDTNSYVAAVAKALNVGADSPIPVRDELPRLAAAIIKHENGIQPYSERELANWVYLT